ATMRTTSDAVRTTLIERSRAIVEGVSAAFGGRGELVVSYGYEALVNHDAEVDVVSDAALELLGPGSVVWKEKPSMGVEDFSYFIKDRPGAFYHLGCGNLGKGITAPLHSAAFELDEDCLPLGAALQALIALRALARGKGETS
ncbi:MAG: hypothetical protein Q8M76_05895, partial [Spirochaetaceae bacterium]|nr:hypothetical protein [Spirochaetaceae bacterium]